MGKWDALTKGITCTFEMRWKRDPDPHDPMDTRDYLWILSACIPIKSVRGRVIGISGCNTDVTAQKESARQALIRSEALERATATERRLAAITELSPCGFFQLAPDLKVGITCRSHEPYGREY
jgi:PAS domain-containing protein